MKTERIVMTERGFVSTGSAPRVTRIQALAFHDGAGRIHHMHHAITLEGAQPRSYEAMLEDARTQAREMGVDLARLKVLHVTAPFDPGAQHKVDVKKGMLVEVQPARPGEGRPRAAAPRIRRSPRPARRR
jgi:hypothetical protein